MPLHTVEAVPRDWCDSSDACMGLGMGGGLPHSAPVDTMGLEVLVAAAGAGVWALPVGSHAMTPDVPCRLASLAPCPGPGTTCESLALDGPSRSIAVSWRQPPAAAAAGPAPWLGSHEVLQQLPLASVNQHLQHSAGDFVGLAGPQCLVGAGSPSAHLATLDAPGRRLRAVLSGSAGGGAVAGFERVATLSGHTSSLVMTRGTFVGASRVRAAQGWFVCTCLSIQCPALTCSVVVAVVAVGCMLMGFCSWHAKIWVHTMGPTTV